MAGVNPKTGQPALAIGRIVRWGSLHGTLSRANAGCPASYKKFVMRISDRPGLQGLALVVATLPVMAAGSGQFKDLLNKVKSSAHRSNSSRLGSNLPTSDIADGLKKALVKGTTNAINSLGRDGGFWNNS